MVRRNGSTRIRTLHAGGTSAATDTRARRVRMTTYLLDTNACIALINGTEINVRRRFKRAVARESVILLSSIVAFELWYGVAKSQRKDSNTQRLETFLGGPLEWALFDEDDARAAGTVRAELEAVGKTCRRLRCPTRRPSPKTRRDTRDLQHEGVRARAGPEVGRLGGFSSLMACRSRSPGSCPFHHHSPSSGRDPAREKWRQGYAGFKIFRR